MNYIKNIKKKQCKKKTHSRDSKKGHLRNAIASTQNALNSTASVIKRKCFVITIVIVIIVSTTLQMLYYLFTYLEVTYEGHAYYFREKS
jgi:t-SNARE complex subunit (syntaxin)